MSHSNFNFKKINIREQKINKLQAHLELMLLIRKTEVQLAKCKEEGIIKGPIHLSVGQEAVAVGVSTALKKKDRVFGAHRSHSHILALNPNPYKLFAEVLGKKTGFSRGMGGSMHLWDKPNGFYGSVPIVAGTVPLAVGAGLAAKLQKTKDISLVYLGDGAVEEGVVHESLNLAKIQNLPVIFVVENNLFASHMHVSLRQSSDKMARFAEANSIPFKVVDGNNIIDVINASKSLVTNARNGSGPGLIEVITYRWYGHVDWREDIDVGVNRSLEDVQNWKKRDPIKRLQNAMEDENIWSEVKQKKLEYDLDNIIINAWNKAIEDEYPLPSSTLDYVFYK
ncbi:thiamine pyrophosphate-dependent dehydrogenase E1 component subunit alpha [Alphaproteobacteria bacterium]|nr:thiamine pyrophosphate-dependent dehydrogenase E1 component subunit alpha [Alphaproteobacteria bacterium]